MDGVLFRDERELEEAVRSYVPNSAEEKTLVRKFDLKLMPMLWCMYVFNYVDRTNIVGIHLVKSYILFTNDQGQRQNLRNGQGFGTG
jgi:hypothetical protein